MGLKEQYHHRSHLSVDGDFPKEALMESTFSQPSTLGICLGLSFMAVKRHHDQGNSYKGKHLIEVDLQFRSSVHHHHDRKHGSIQAGLVLGEWRVLCSDSKTARRRRRLSLPYWAELEHQEPLKALLYNDTLPPIRPHPLMVALPMSQVYSNHHSLL